MGSRMGIFAHFRRVIRRHRGVLVDLPCGKVRIHLDEPRKRATIIVRVPAGTPVTMVEVDDARLTETTE